jgi:hypothetical protein
MTDVLGVLFVVVGVSLIVFAPRLARARVSLHVSPEDLAATSGPRYRRTHRLRLIACALNIVAGAFLSYVGLCTIFSWWPLG